MDRMAHITRKTKETDIDLTLNIDGSGKSEIKTASVFLTICWQAFPNTVSLT